MTLTNQQRAALVAEAKTWIGTPYAGHSHMKGCGADCGQVLYGIYRNCGLLPEIELPTDYSLQAAQHQVSTEYVDFVDKFFRPVTESEAQPGDVVLYKLRLAFAHAAIIIEWPGYILQASVDGFSGAHGTLTPAWRRRPRIFRTLRDEYCGGGL